MDVAGHILISLGGIAQSPIPPSVVRSLTVPFSVALDGVWNLTRREVVALIRRSKDGRSKFVSKYHGQKH